MTDLHPLVLWAELQKYPLFVVEAELFVLFLILLVIHRRFVTRFLTFSASVDPLHKLSPVSAVAAFSLIALIAHAAALPVLRDPVPGVHDEFSFLLAADTFSAGRLANPVHPLWPHFESFHINQQPTYASMYPAGPGLLLAVGQLLGKPIIGVWIGTALFCGALYWMLLGWLPGSWAFIGGIICILRLGVFSYWANTFWGGSLAALGGCLVWGAIGRLRGELRASSAVCLSTGLLIIANSRPYEGAWLAAIAAAALATILFKNSGISFATVTRRVVIPATLVVTAGAAMMAYYNSRVFGSPLRMPYTTNRATYAVAPNFLWESPRQIAPNYHHRVMRQFYQELEMTSFEAARSTSGMITLTRLKLYTVWLFFLGPALTVPLIAYLVSISRRIQDAGWPAAGLAVVLVGLLLLCWPTNPHYYAPAVGCLYFILMQGLRVLSGWRNGKYISGAHLALAAILACCAVVPVRATAKWLGITQVNSLTPIPWHAAELFPLELRAKLNKQLSEQGGKHVVVVRYGPNHSPFAEFVYNEAEIDSAKVIWARELPDALANQALMRYYRDRKIWLLRPDESEKLEPHPWSKFYFNLHGASRKPD